MLPQFYVGNLSLSGEQVVTIQEPVLPYQNSQVVKKRQRDLKQLVDKFSAHKSSKICKKIKFRDEFFQVGDYVIVSGVHTLKYICKILNLFVFDPTIQGIPIVQLQWCLQKRDLKQLELQTEFISDYEIFPSTRRICQYITAIIKKCDVFSLQEYLYLQSTNKNYFFTRAKFNTLTLCLEPPMQLWKKVCICKKIAVPLSNGKQFILCNKCSQPFHRQCLGKPINDEIMCNQCFQQIQNPSVLQLQFNESLKKLASSIQK